MKKKKAFFIKESLDGELIPKEAAIIYLQDCGHILIVNDMEKWVNAQMERTLEGTNIQEVNLLTCPVCQTIIINCDRYEAQIKSRLNIFNKIKSRYFGSEEENKKFVENIIKKLEKIENKKIINRLKNFITNVPIVPLNVLISIRNTGMICFKLKKIQQFIVDDKVPKHKFKQPQFAEFMAHILFMLNFLQGYIERLGIFF